MILDESSNSDNNNNNNDTRILIQCEHFVTNYELLLSLSSPSIPTETETATATISPKHISIPHQIVLLRYNALYVNNNSNTSDNNRNNDDDTLVNNNTCCNDKDNDNKDDELILVGLPKRIVQSFDTIVSLFLQNSLQMKSLSVLDPNTIATTEQGNQTQLHQNVNAISIKSLKLLQRYVTVIHCLCQHDIVLEEELAKQGIHKLFIQLLQIENKYNDDNDNDNDDNDNDDHNNDNNEYDNIIECIKDNVSDIISITTTFCNISFPCIVNPYTINELQLRLPLCFSLLLPKQHLVDQQEQKQQLQQEQNQQQLQQQQTEKLVHRPMSNYYANMNDTILINQVLTRQSAQEDVGFVVWPAALILSRWIEQNVQAIVHLATATIQKENDVISSSSSSSSSSIRILELGCGCGLSGLTIGKLLQKQQQQYQKQEEKENLYQVILSDFNSIVVKNVQQNILLNNLQDTCMTIGLDFYYYYNCSNSNINTNDNVSDTVAELSDLDSVETIKNNKSTSTLTANSWYDMDSTEQAPVHVVIGADIICQESDSYACVATLETILYSNGYAYIICGSSHHRYGINVFATAVDASKVLTLVKTISITLCNGTIIVSNNDNVNDDDVDSNNTKCIDSFNFDCFQQEHIQSEIGQTAGYVNGMELLFFIIQKRKKERNMKYK